MEQKDSEVLASLKGLEKRFATTPSKGATSVALLFFIGGEFVLRLYNRSLLCQLHDVGRNFGSITHRIALFYQCPAAQVPLCPEHPWLARSCSSDGTYPVRQVSALCAPGTVLHVDVCHYTGGLKNANPPWHRRLLFRCSPVHAQRSPASGLSRSLHCFHLAGRLPPSSDSFPFRHRSRRQAGQRPCIAGIDSSVSSYSYSIIN